MLTVSALFAWMILWSFAAVYIPVVISKWSEASEARGVHLTGASVIIVWMGFSVGMLLFGSTVILEQMKGTRLWPMSGIFTTL